MARDSVSSLRWPVVVGVPEWGAVGPYGFVGNTRGDNEIDIVGVQSVTIGGREYLRTGTRRPPAAVVPYLQPGEFFVDTRYGGVLLADAADRVPEGGGFWNGPGPVLLAGGLLAGVLAPAFGAAGAAGGAFDGVTASAGVGSAFEVGAGEGVLEGFAASASAGGFSLPSLPPGVSSAFNAARSFLGGAVDSVAGAVQGEGGGAGLLLLAGGVVLVVLLLR